MSHPLPDIRRRAARLLADAGVTHEPVSLRAVISALNLELVQTTRQPFAPEGALQPLGDTHAIVLHGDSDECRRRFTIAHEIGHFVLHPGGARSERGGVVNEAGRVREREADQFAAELLMPEALVREAAQAHGADPERLAARFEVSRRAMELRLQRLGVG